MARPRNEAPEGAVYHVWARGNNRGTLFEDDEDRGRYLGMLEQVIDRTGWRCLAYCLMGNHLHLIIETRTKNLGDGFRVLHSRYAQRFNRRHGRTGHLFEGRFGSKVMKDDAQMCTTVRYIALNPVKAGLCSHPADWRWSSAPWILRKRPPQWLDVGRLLGFFSWLGGDRHKRYAEMVQPAPPPARAQPPPHSGAG